MVPTLFDAVEFSDEIATGDVLYDLAFLLMDLEERGLRASANRLFNRYLAPEPPRLVAVGGLSGGPRNRSIGGQARAFRRTFGAKCYDRPSRAAVVLEPAPSVRARSLKRSPLTIESLSAGRLDFGADRGGRAPGALWLRSDLERKAMFGVEETVGLPVYERLIDKARIALRAGQAVLLDATFATSAERSAAAGAAAEVGVDFAGLFLDAPLATRLERIASRRADASDADADVARRQTAEPLSEKGWAAVGALGSLSDTMNWTPFVGPRVVEFKV
jgi:hypothetical protein